MTNRHPALRVFLLFSLLLLFGANIRGQNRGTFIGAVNHPAGSPATSSNTGFLGGGIVPFEGKLADVNGDGKPDLIVAAACSNFSSSQCPNGYAVVTYLSNGDGTFQPPILSGGGTIPPPIRSMAVGDFNNDGKLDVAVASDCQLSATSGGCITILIGVGDGTFVQSAQYTFDGIVSQAGTLAVGDFNHDGKLDLVVGDACFNLSVTVCQNGAVRIFLGNGDGTLAAPTNYTTAGNSAVYPIVGDFNGDGNLDIIAGTPTPSGSLITILIGNGNGTFTQSIATLPFYGLSALAAADLNGDGKLDLAIALTNGGSLQILFGNGDGTFQTPIPVPTSLSNQVTNGNAILPIDLNGDGKPDLMVSGGFGGSNVNGVQIFLNDGSGNFTSTVSYPMGGWQYNPTVAADFNGDGKADVAMASGCSESTGHGCPDGSIVVLLGNGDGTFQGPVVISTPGSGGGVFSSGASDFNSDGILDLFTSGACVPGSSQQCGAAVLLGNPNGTYQAPTIVQSGAQVPAYSLAADFNRDGTADLAILNACDSSSACNSPSVSISLGNGDGTFQSPVTYPVVGSAPVGIVTGDFNGDGKLDLAVATQCMDSSCTQGAVSILLGNADGTFQNAVTTGIGAGIGVSISAGDLDHDGKTDVVVGNTNPTTNNPYAEFVTILLSNGDGTLRIAGSYDSGGAATPNGVRGVTAVTGDINHDGNLDVVVANGCESDLSHDVNCANGSIGVLLGNGDGTFQQVRETVVTDGNLVSANLADVDGDGNLDLIASTTGGVMVARGQGDGTFQTPVIYGGLSEFGNQMVLAVTDLNNDGAPDIVQPDPGGNLAIFYNRGGTFLTTQSSLNPSTWGQNVTFTATVSPSIAKNLNPTGIVSFYLGNQSTGMLLANFPLIGGTASLTLNNVPVGTWPITIAYSGDTNFNPHNSQTLVQVVTATLASTQTTLASSLNPSGAGQSVTFTATVSGGASPTGSITFKDGSTALATTALTGNQASYATSSLSVGSHPMTAIYSGDASNASSTSPALYQSIFSAQPGSLIYGVVTNRLTGAPLGGVKVNIRGPSYALFTTTDVNGFYAMTGAQVTDVSGQVFFSGQGYFIASANYDLSSGVPLNINQTLLPGGTMIQGVVSDSSTGAPIVGATVYVAAAFNGLQMTTGPGGSYSFDSSLFYESSASGFLLSQHQVSAPGYLTNSANDNLQVSPPFPLTANYHLVPGTGIAIQGQVTDRKTGLPVAGVKVNTRGPSYSLFTTTDSSGNYSLTGTQATDSSGQIFFAGQGYFIASTNYDLTAGVPVTINQTLLPGGTMIQGVVSDSSTGAPIVGATVYVAAAFNGMQMTTGPGGSYSFDSSLFYESSASGFLLSQHQVSAPGYLTNSANDNLQVSPPFPLTARYPLLAGGPYQAVTVSAQPTGLLMSVDGTNLTSPQSFQWPTGSVHTLSVTSPQGTGGTQNVFTQWSDSGTQSHQVAISGPATYTASFQTQYLLTTLANPPADGTITAGGWFNAGASVTINAVANSGFLFSGFTGDVSGTTNPQTLVMSSPKNVAANFVTNNILTLSSSPNPSQAGQQVLFSLSDTLAGETVQFLDGGNALGTATVTGAGTASFSTSTLSVGTHSITAQSQTTGNVSNVVMQTVLPPVLVSISVGPVNPSIPLSAIQQFTVTGTYSDGSTQDVTNSATWSSTTQSVATINSTGLASAAGLGQTVIQAVFGGIGSSSTLTVTPGFVLTGSLNNVRAFHTATQLNNGMVLVAGGEGASSILATAELYNPATGTFTSTGNLITARDFHTTTLLNNGKVLITGGSDSSGNTLASAELYDPATGSFTSTGSLNTPRYDHTATLLNNGMVLIAGGLNPGNYSASAELYNPATGTFTSTGNLTTTRALHTATLLNNGMVLIAGGGGNNGLVTTAELYDPATGTFSATGTLNTVRRYHTATLLNNGAVLIAGGADSAGNSLSETELYDFATGVFSVTGSMNSARIVHTATLLSNGMVLIAGGYNNLDGILANAELYDPTAGTFNATGSLNTKRYIHTATLLSNGTVLIAGGQTYGGNLASAELYQAGTLTPANLVSIAVSPSNPTVSVGATQRFTATGTLSNSITQTLHSVIWSSSNASVGTITNDTSNQSAVAVQGPGTTTIMACDGAICGSTTLTGASAVATLSASSLTFANQAVGTTSAIQTVTITNTGTAPMTFSTLGLAGTFANDYNAIQACPRPPVTLGIGTSCSVNIAFAPTGTGPRPASFAITDDASGSPQTISLSGNGVAATTTTSLTASVNPAVYSQPVNFTATVNSSSGTPTGTVPFYAGSTLIGTGMLTNGTATISAAFSAVGPSSITASYIGDATHSPSTSAALTETVNKASTTTSVASSQNPQLVGQPITLTATIASQFGGGAGGSVTFKAGATTLGTAPISGNKASLTTSFSTAGTRSITAQYGGDANNTGSTSAALSQSIVAKFTTTTALTSSLNPSFVGQTVTFTATVSSAGGAIPNGELITFKRGVTTLATVPLASGSASFTTSTLAAGTNTITASYAGDATFNASTSGGLKQVVNKYATTTALTSSLNPSIFGQAVIFTATVTSAGPNTPTGTVTFKNGATSLATVTLSGGIATLTRSNLSSGTPSITASYNGDTASGVSTSSALSQVVSQATTATTLVSSRNPCTFGQTVKFTATVSSPTVTPTGTVTFFDGGTTLGTGTLAGGKASFSTTSLSRGSHTITAVYSGTANIIGSSSTVLAQVVN